MTVVTKLGIYESVKSQASTVCITVYIYLPGVYYYYYSFTTSHIKVTLQHFTASHGFVATKIEILVAGMHRLQSAMHISLHLRTCMHPQGDTETGGNVVLLLLSGMSTSKTFDRLTRRSLYRRSSYSFVAKAASLMR